MTDSLPRQNATCTETPAVFASDVIEVQVSQRGQAIISINGVSILAGETMSLPSGARLTCGSCQTVTYDPNGAFAGMSTKQSAQDRFAVSLQDANGVIESFEQFVLVLGENEPPLAEDDFVKSTVNSKVTFTVLETDAGPEAYTVALLSQPSNGLAFVNENGTITFEPQDEWVGTVDIHYTVEDRCGTFNDATLTIEVEPEYFSFPFAEITTSHFMGRRRREPSREKS